MLSLKFDMKIITASLYNYAATPVFLEKNEGSILINLCVLHSANSDILTSELIFRKQTTGQHNMRIILRIVSAP